MLSNKHSLNMPILVSYFPITLFVLIFFTEIHASQISKVMPSQTINIEPLTLESEDHEHVIIIKLPQINIYKSSSIYKLLSWDDRTHCIYDHAFRVKTFIAHNENHSDTKLVGAEYDECLKKFSNKIPNVITK